jgi:hypothetical protein
MKILSLLIPLKDPIIVGYGSTSNPFYVRVGESDLSIVKSIEIANVASNSMCIRNRFKSDTQLTWAYSATPSETVYVSSVDYNDAKIQWTKKYSQTMTEVVIVYTEVFEQYVMAGKNTVDLNNCFIRFDPDNGDMKFLK